MTGDSAWSLFAQPTLEEARNCLQDRADRGFNLVVATLIEHEFATSAPGNANSGLPFIGDPFTTPSEACFAHDDSIVEFASSLDIVLFLAPVYIGHQCGDQGWYQEMQDVTLSQMRDWAQFIGQRYGSYDKLMWSTRGGGSGRVCTTANCERPKARRPAKWSC